jgi:cation diffusion facilitator family transporter
MLAEAIHSYADCGNQALLIWGLREAKRSPTADHPLGFGKAIYFWSFIVALMLFSMGGLFSIYEGLHKLGQPEPVKHAWVAVAILAFGVLAESISLWGCLREIDKDRGDRNLWQWFRTSRQSELLVVLGEDLAALGGLATALCFILLSMVSGDPMWDAVGSIAIGALLVVVAIFVGVEVKALLVGQSAEPQVLARMRAHLLAQPDVDSIYSLLTQQLGSEVMVAVKARMRPLATDVALVEAINRVERGLREQFPQVRWIFFEPDLHD